MSKVHPYGSHVTNFDSEDSEQLRDILKGDVLKVPNPEACKKWLQWFNIGRSLCKVLEIGSGVHNVRIVDGVVSFDVHPKPPHVKKQRYLCAPSMDDVEKNTGWGFIWLTEQQAQNQIYDDKFCILASSETAKAIIAANPELREKFDDSEI